MAVISYFLLFSFFVSSSSVFSDADPGHKTGNLAIRVEESSDSPSYLAIRFLNLGAQTEIVAVDVAPVGSPNWNFMNRKTEAIWETNSVPSGPLQFRVVVTAGLEGKWYWASKVMPEDWRNGEIYDTGLHITDTSIMDTAEEL
nr:expansin-like A3 [Ipomoea trifida]